MTITIMKILIFLHLVQTPSFLNLNEKRILIRVVFQEILNNLNLKNKNHV